MTLVIPWVARKDQEVIFPNNITFDNPSQQEQWVRCLPLAPGPPPHPQPQAG